MNPFFLNHGMEKEQLVATKAINSLALQGTKLLSYVSLGVITLEMGIQGIIIGLGGIAGVFWARHHLQKIDDEGFRRYTLLLMPIGGIILIIKAFYELT